MVDNGPPDSPAGAAPDDDADFEELLAELRDVLEDLSEDVDVDRDDIDVSDGLVEAVTMVVGVPSRADLSVLLGAAADLTRRIDERVDDPEPPFSGALAYATVLLVDVLRELDAALDDEATADSAHVRRLNRLADRLETRVDDASLPDLSSPADALDRLTDALGSGSDDFAGDDDATYIEVED